MINCNLSVNCSLIVINWNCNLNCNAQGTTMFTAINEIRGLPIDVFKVTDTLYMYRDAEGFTWTSFTNLLI